MKIAIISDARGNAPALHTVLKHMETQEIDIKVSLGNTIGYSPYPNETIDLTALSFNYILSGKFDWISSSKDKPIGFSALDTELIEWTQKNTAVEKKLLISQFPSAFSWEQGDLLFANNTVSDFAQTGIDTEEEAEISFTSPIAPFTGAFIGNTGVPCIWLREKDGTISYVRPKYAMVKGVNKLYTYKAPEDAKMIVNVGSLGLPKDNDPMASYVIYDTETREVTFFRVKYDLDRTIGKLQQKSLSNQSWMRLLYGK